ncbi:MAG: hypothetical protein ABIN36_18890 [Ferruginibacter sp.]
MQKTSLSTEQTLKYTNDTISDIDEKKIEALEMGKVFQLLKHNHLKAELMRLTAKKGDKDIIVQKMEARIACNEIMFPALDLQMAIMKKGNDSYDPDTWRIQGFVFSANERPLKLIVSLVSQKEQTTKIHLSSNTDDLGFFSITVEKQMIAKLKSLKLFLQVSDNKKNIIHKVDKTLLPAGGTIDIEDILIPADHGPIL